MIFRFLYNIILTLFYPVVQIAALFSGKIALFVAGRRDIFGLLKLKEVDKGTWVWFHVASLGEFEQARPLMEAFKKSFSNHKILLTFFSPSGYEIQKQYDLADCVCYLPWDTKKNVNRFLDFCNIKLALFIKYEFWPNCFNGLSKRKIPTYSVSSIFRPEQVFFRWYGGAFRNILLDINHFFVQNESSKSLLNSIGIDQVTVNADTRVDRVYKMSRQNNKLELMEDFTAGKKCFVAGSTWPEDHDIMEHLFKKETQLKVVIAPHEVDHKSIEKLEKRMGVDCAKWSSYNSEKDRNKSILIIDNIGQLGKVYSYASFAYVGGGMKKNGLHNTLEPAAYGIPIIIGEHYNRYEEAVSLLKWGGMISVKSAAEFKEITHKLINDKKLTHQMGENNNQYILSGKGASQLILKKIESLSGL